MRAAWRAVILILVLTLATLPSVESAEEKVAHVQWDYRLSLPDPASGNVHVDLTLSGFAGAVTRFTFATVAHREPVTNITGGPSTEVLPADGAGGVSFDVDGDESISYDVRVERPAFRPGEFLSHAGSDFALFKAESVTLEFTYKYYSGTTFVNSTTVRLAPPAGWDAAGPWQATVIQVYDIADGEPLPRGYVVFGKFLSREDHVVAGKNVHYVRLGKPASYDGELFDVIEKTTPYYAAVYGPGVHSDVLIVNAPDPMFHGGLGGADSFFIHETADIRTVAHEYAHVFQLFGTNERAGTSSIWLNEGDADYHSALALHAAFVWDASQVNDFLRAALDDKRDPKLSGARLTNATYGSDLERFAYHKGALIIQALDVRMRHDSGGQVGVSDVLRDINARHGLSSSEETAKPVTNEEVQAVAERLLGQDLADLFNDYVFGTQWPSPTTFVPEGELLVGDLRLDPSRASPHEDVLVVANLTNRGTKAIKPVVSLLVDGVIAENRTVELAIGQSKREEFTLSAGAPGDHEVRLLYAHTTLHSLSPPSIAIVRTSAVPVTVHAGEDEEILVFLRNDGERPGSASVTLRDTNGTLLAATTESVVAANSTSVVTLHVRFGVAGSHDVTATVSTLDGDERKTISVDVLDTARSDEVPGLIPGNSVPSPVWGTVLAALSALAITRRRR